jgi:type III pantothenate kinase
MLLVIDVGNTNIVLGVYDGERLVRRFRIQTVKGRTSDEMGALLMDLFRHGELQGRIDGAIVSSVVPDLVRPLEQCCAHWFQAQALVVGPGIRTGLPILVDNPKEVGADRIVNSVAAYAQVGGACVIVDFGTATTFDCVSARGEYVGGAIAPGLQISADALFRAASRLPRVEVDRPRRAIGKNTVDAMQSGLFFGYASMVDGMVARVIAELDAPAKPAVLATGGLAAVIAPATTSIERVDDDLTLLGLRILFERNRRQDA